MTSLRIPAMTNAAVGMPCPVCRIPLVMSERQGVEIDYCPQCRGVWLDRGELDKLIERNAQQAAPPPQRPAYSPSHDERGYSGYAQPHGHGHRKRKKSCLEELFEDRKSTRLNTS